MTLYSDVNELVLLNKMCMIKKTTVHPHFLFKEVLNSSIRPGRYMELQISSVKVEPSGFAATAVATARTNIGLTLVLYAKVKTPVLHAKLWMPFLFSFLRNP